jgi:hypothetical protein
MIRRLSFAILFASSTIVFAQPLYKWVEADGSITFSPTKPLAGTSYETVNKPTGSLSLNKATLEQASRLPARQAGSNAITPSSAKLEYAPAQGAALPDANQQLSNAPTAPAALSSQSQSTANSQVRGNVLGKPAPLAEARTRSQSIAASASSNKQRRCQDLRKRVISLERRLKSRLTPEDMDNTVVHMARYQRSFDQHCVQ